LAVRLLERGGERRRHVGEALDAPGLPVGRNAIKEVLRVGRLEEREQAERPQTECVNG
jgi:hypothetical protein